ncbi:hypothetical protein AN958_10482 [Leucoagaricus sp. SymC.cos]|nr:hypothetical protein AN958_10482 [Leucoagaricus sp. SymC.cos]
MTAVHFQHKLEPGLKVFSTKLFDSKHVFVLPERPDSKGELEHRLTLHSLIEPERGPRMPIVKLRINKTTDTWTFTQRLNMGEPMAREALLNQSKVEVKPTTLHTIAVSFGNHMFFLPFPLPVDGARSMTRIAHKFSYIEVDVPVLMNPKERLSKQPFPLLIFRDEFGPSVVLWNMPYVNLNTFPAISLSSSTDWIFTHDKLAFSIGERELMFFQPNEKYEAMTLFKDTFRGILSMLIVTKKTVILLADLARPKLEAPGTTLSYDPYTCLFINGLKIDLASGTVICDAAVIFLDKSTLPLLVPFWNSSSPAVAQTFAKEVTIWKYALPAFAERCPSGTVICDAAVIFLDKSTLPLLVPFWNSSSPAVAQTFAKEVTIWMYALPAFAEHCRGWKHLSTCEYIQRQTILLSRNYNETPVCSYGRGKNLAPLEKMEAWKKLLPEDNLGKGGNSQRYDEMHQVPGERET